MRFWLGARGEGGSTIIGRPSQMKAPRARHAALPTSRRLAVRGKGGYSCADWCHWDWEGGCMSNDMCCEKAALRIERAVARALISIQARLRP